MPRNWPLDSAADAALPGLGGKVVWNSVDVLLDEVMLKISEFEMAPPGLATVIVAVPADAIKLAGTVVVN